MCDSNDQSDEHAETDENDDPSVEVDADSRLSFVRVVPSESLAQKKNIPAHKKNVLILWPIRLSLKE